MADVALSSRQVRAIAALLATDSLGAAARQAGVSDRSLARWLNEDAGFRAALAAAEGQVIDAAVRRLVGLADTAIKTLQTVMADTEIPAGVRVRAALGVLNSLTGLRELRDLETRLAALEERVGK